MLLEQDTRNITPNNIAFGIIPVNQIQQAHRPLRQRQALSVVVSTPFNVCGDICAPNIYNKTHVDYITVMMRATLTSSTSLRALKINASGAGTAAHIYSDGTVNALNMNGGPISAQFITVVANSSFTTTCLSDANAKTVSDHIYSPMQLPLKANTMKVSELTNTTFTGFKHIGISLGADVAMNTTIINGLTNLTASGTIRNDIATTNTLTTSGGGITKTSHLVLCRGLNNSICMDAHPHGVLFYNDVFR